MQSKFTRLDIEPLEGISSWSPRGHRFAHLEFSLVFFGNAYLLSEGKVPLQKSWSTANITAPSGVRADFISTRPLAFTA